MSTTRKALILGVAPAQRDAIEYLKSCGWHVIGCSYRREGLGIGLLDRFELIDILDGEALLHLARKEKVDLVYSVGSDIAMPIVSELAMNLGLPSFVNSETARLMQNKVMFRKFLCERNISPVAWRKVARAEDVEGWTSFPAILKPACSQGQRGVFLVTSSEEAVERLPEAIAFSPDGQAVMEEYLDGREMSANLFLVDGKIEFALYSNRIVVENVPGGIPKSHEIPASLSEKERLDTDDLLKKMVTALNLKNGPVYVQLKLTSSGPRIIEAAPRLDGCHLWRLIKLSTGVDLMEVAFKMLHGEEVGDALKPKQDKTCSLDFLFGTPMSVFHEEAFTVPRHAVHFEFYYRNGETVRPINGRLEKVGYFITRKDTGIA